MLINFFVPDAALIRVNTVMLNVEAIMTMSTTITRTIRTMMNLMITVTILMIVKLMVTVIMMLIDNFGNHGDNN